MSTTRPTGLTECNYYESRDYFSVSMLKQFLGAPGIKGCEARALAEWRGDYQRPATDALLLGSYVDVGLTGTEAEQVRFKEDHPELFSTRGATKGQLKSTFRKADDMVARALRDRDDGGVFMRFLEGDWQRIVTGEIHGHPFKGKLDVLGDGFICDLKTTESITKKYYADGWYDFIHYWGYDLQGAVYQELVYQTTGARLPFYIAAISKETPCDLGVYQVPQDELDQALETLTPEKLGRIQALIDGDAEPERCGRCDWCRQTKVIKAPEILSVV